MTTKVTKESDSVYFKFQAFWMEDQKRLLEM